MEITFRDHHAEDPNFFLVDHYRSRFKRHVNNSPLTTNKPCSPLPHGLPPSGFRLGVGARSVPLHTAGTVRLSGLLPHKNKKRSVASPACPKNPAVFRYTTTLRPPTGREKVGLTCSKGGYVSPAAQLRPLLPFCLRLGKINQKPIFPNRSGKGSPVGYLWALWGSDTSLKERENHPHFSAG